MNIFLGINKTIRKLPRRFRFVFSSIFLTGIMLLSTFFDFEFAAIWLVVLILLTYATTYFAVFEGIAKWEHLFLFVVPILFSVSVYYFYFLFPVRWLTRLPLVLIYGLSTYAILLSSNIFNVGVEKNIQLFRAAFSVNFLFQTLITFLASETIMSFDYHFLVKLTLIGTVFFLLSLQLLWSVQPSEKLQRELVFKSVLIVFILIQAAILISFLPFKTTIYALFLTASYYSVSGLMYHFVDEKLFKQTIREYGFVFIFVCILVILTLPW